MNLRVKRTKLIITFLLAFFVFCGVFLGFSTNDNICYAVLPEKYVETVRDEDLEWQTGADFLNVTEAKQTVLSWFQDSRYNFESFNTKPIVIAVIDTGISFNHQIFTGKYDRFGKPLSVDKGDYDVLYRDFRGDIIGASTSGGASLSDVDPSVHGTHVAGLIAELIHMFDLEKQIKIMPIAAATKSATGSVSFSEKAFKQAVSFALENGADVVNMSLGDISASAKESFSISQDKVTQAVFVAAAGNNGASSEKEFTKGRFYPAAGDGVIGVMNLYNKSPLALWQTSNYGSLYDICAPGTYLYSADGKTQDSYKSMTGTSMASPVVSFAAALLTLKYRALESSSDFTATPVNIRAMLKAIPSTRLIKDAVSYPTLQLGALVNADYLNDIKFAETVGKTPQRLDVTCTGNTSQEQGRVLPLRLNASIYPYDYASGVIKWYAQYGASWTYIGTGKEVYYTPTNLVGNYVIKAELNGYKISFSTVVSVTEKQIRKEEIKINVIGNVRPDGKIAIGTKIGFSVEDVPYVDISGIPLKWYDNGEIQAVGGSYVFFPLTSGEHKITAVFNDETLLTYQVFVDENLNVNLLNFYSPLELFSFIFVGITTVIGISIAIVIEVRRKKSKKSKRDL